ncbi:MAG: bacteriohemerythrin [Leptospiraceae bacterium]|nr:bacteriohemerythrin [Leptospiraceae bacterium]
MAILKNIEIKYKILGFFLIIVFIFLISNLLILHQVNLIEDSHNQEVLQINKYKEKQTEISHEVLKQFRDFSFYRNSIISNLKLYIYLSLPIWSLLLASLLYFSFVIPLRNSFRLVLKAMDKMTKGEMNEPIQIDVMDEIGRILQSIRVVRVILQGIFCEITSISNMISDSAKEMREYADTFIETSEKLTESSVEASLSVQELANLAQDIADANLQEGKFIKTVSEGIKKANTAFRTIKHSVQDLNSIASESAKNAEISSHSAQLALNAMDEINSNSSNIQSMVSLIKDISKQINLLALNASIEAARAGEAGKGFTVVADEVSNLATKTDATVREVEKNIILTRNAVTNGVKQVKETELSIRKIIDGSKNIDAKVKSITGMISSQNKDMSELENYSDKMVNIAQVIETTSIMQKDIAIEIRNMVLSVEQELKSITNGSNMIVKLANDKIRIAAFLQTIMSGFDIDSSILIKWDDALKVNIQKIDDQHEQLIQMINQLYKVVQTKNPPKDKISSILQSLIKYVQVHFKTEEDLFYQYNYPNSVSHKKEHDKFANQVLEFQKDFELGVQTVGFELLDFLKNWLVKHILVSDKKYSKYLNDKKVF